MVVSHLPIGLISKKCTGVRRMALNMLLCRVWAELTRILKKSKLRRKPNTTEVAVKPEKSREGKKIHQHTTMLSFMPVPRLAMHLR